MEGWAMVVLFVVYLSTGMLVIACIAAGRRADDKLEELGAELRVRMAALETSVPPATS